MSEEKFWGIRHYHRCCPEYGCLYEDWDGHHCQNCGMSCNYCFEKEKEEDENDIRM